jgi:hypothetical protein
MILGERGFAPKASGNRCAEKFRQGPKLGPSLRPVNARAGINHWALSSRQNCGGPPDVLWIGPKPDGPDGSVMQLTREFVAPHISGDLDQRWSATSTT